MIASIVGSWPKSLTAFAAKPFVIFFSAKPFVIHVASNLMHNKDVHKFILVSVARTSQIQEYKHEMKVDPCKV